MPLLTADCLPYGTASSNHDNLKGIAREKYPDRRGVHCHHAHLGTKYNLDIYIMCDNPILRSKKDTTSKWVSRASTARSLPLRRCGGPVGFHWANSSLAVTAFEKHITGCGAEYRAH
jgi:hypothetical protein